MIGGGVQSTVMCLMANEGERAFGRLSVSGVGVSESSALRLSLRSTTFLVSSSRRSSTWARPSSRPS